MTRTFSPKPADVQHDWLVIDATNVVLGRLASHVAALLRGKHKPNFTPHADCGDNVIVINASAVTLSGTKMDTKRYIRYTGYPGGQRFSTPAAEMAKNPERVLETAVRGMLPKNRLGRDLFRNMYVYGGAEHPHEAQQPVSINA